ncbi:MAG: class I SAM-dependent methyltransferase [Methanobacteriota archaeon]
MSVLSTLLGKGVAWRPEPALPLSDAKFDRIVELARGRDVLDVGCVGGEIGAELARTSHARIAAVARSCVGVDVVASEVARWQAAGYEAVVADAERLRLGRTFDVIVAADVIEHLANPGLFLESVRDHLRPDGRLCVVTPNALSLNNALKSLAGYRVTVNPEHTCWYDRTTLRQLLARYGLEVAEEYWQDYRRHPLTGLALRFRRSLAAHIIVIARFANGGRRG